MYLSVSSNDAGMKYIEVVDGHHVTEKQKGQVRIQICEDNGKPFIATLHNVILSPDLYNRLFSINTLMNAVTLPHSAQSKHAFLGKIKDMSKKKNYQQERKLL